jgi:hypothetical protein
MNGPRLARGPPKACIHAVSGPRAEMEPAGRLERGGRAVFESTASEANGRVWSRWCNAPGLGNDVMTGPTQPRRVGGASAPLRLGKVGPSFIVATPTARHSSSDRRCSTRRDRAAPARGSRL